MLALRCRARAPPAVRRGRGAHRRQGGIGALGFAAANVRERTSYVLNDEKSSLDSNFEKLDSAIVVKKNCSVFKGKTRRSAVGAPLTLTHSPHPLPLAEHIYLRAAS